jgi:predicted HicB family RNase H-like nuclease
MGRPKQYSEPRVRINLLLPVSVKARLRLMARQEGRSANALIIRMIQKYRGGTSCR